MSKLAPKARRRASYMMLGFLVAGLALVFRIGQIQLFEGKHLSALVHSQLAENKILQSPRGTIYDRNGRPLAITIVCKTLTANPYQIKETAEKAANLLSPVLNIPVDKLKQMFTQDSGFVWVKRTMDSEQAKAVAAVIKENGLPGLDLIDENKRFYPNETLASQILGFVGTDDKGLEGLEMALDNTVRGDLDKQTVESDRRGRPIFKSIFDFTPRKQGKSVALTIDSSIQFIVEQSLDAVMAKTRAKGATIIVMNPRTGEILAMASRPNFNPNQFDKYSPDQWRNRAVSTIYEPGSTFKAVVAAAALQEKVVYPEERFVDNGYVEVSGRRIGNWSGDGYGNVSFLDIIKNSINTSFVQIGMRLGAAKLTDYVRSFGFGEPTGVELPGEEKGLLFDPKDMRASDLATMSIGQSIAVTPLQLITAIAAIANDGVLLKPHIVKDIYNPDGSLAQTMSPEVVRQVIAPETAKTLKGLLEKVVSEGGGGRAKVPGYHFGGKTGTAERLKSGGSGYDSGRYIASFAGFGPVEDPQIAALIVIDDPQGAYYGGEIAAPVFSEIMTQIMRYLGIPPQEPLAVPLPAAPAANHATGLGILPGQPSGQGKAFVPSVTGMTIREAGNILTKQGLSFVPRGSGVAVRQSVRANVAVDVGTEVIVDFEPR